MEATTSENLLKAIKQANFVPGILLTILCKDNGMGPPKDGNYLRIQKLAGLFTTHPAILMMLKPSKF